MLEYWWAPWAASTSGKVEHMTGNSIFRIYGVELYVNCTFEGIDVYKGLWSSHLWPFYFVKIQYGLLTWRVKAYCSWGVSPLSSKAPDVHNHYEFDYIDGWGPTRVCNDRVGPGLSGPERPGEARSGPERTSSQVPAEHALLASACRGGRAAAVRCVPQAQRVSSKTPEGGVLKYRRLLLNVKYTSRLGVGCWGCNFDRVLLYRMLTFFFLFLTGISYRYRVEFISWI